MFSGLRPQANGADCLLEAEIGNLEVYCEATVITVDAPVKQLKLIETNGLILTGSYFNRTQSVKIKNIKPTQ